MKVLFWDVETSDMELAVRTYQLKNHIRYFDPKDIVRDWTMLGAAWKFQGQKKVDCISVSPKDPLNDYEVVKTLHGVLNEAEWIVGHNSDNFDFKKFNTRAIFYGLPPVSPKVSIDTLKVARKYFKFSSNKLSYIANFLGLDAKDESPDWKKVIEGCPKELRYMRKYNKQDVIVTEQVYEKLKSFHYTHPKKTKTVRDIKGEILKEACPRCYGTNTKINKNKITATGIQRRQYFCKDGCGYWTESVIK